MVSARRRAYIVYKEYGVLQLILSTFSYGLRMTAMAIVHVLDRLCTKSPGLVLFHNKNGYEGNSRRVFEWIVENQPTDLRPVWVTHDISQYRNLRSLDMNVVFTYSPRGVYTLARATVLCYDNEHYRWYPDSLEVVRIRHEIPVKGGPYGRNDTDKGTNDPKQRGTDVTVEKTYDHILFTSEFLAGEHLIRSDVSVVTAGYPRNDDLLDVPAASERHWCSFTEATDFDFVFLYAPTRRRYKYESEIDLFPFEDFDSEVLHDRLETWNALLLIRLHPEDEHNTHSYPTVHPDGSLSGFIDRLTASDRIEYVGSDSFEETVDVLPFVDCLLTDYSTIYHTYLLLDRPLVFFPYDYETAARVEGFKYDYFDHLPGPAIESFEDFLAYSDQLVAGDDPHKEERADLRERLYDHTDSIACKRVVEYIRGLAILEGNNP